MKKLYTMLVPILIGIIMTAGSSAQAPQKMSYQCVIRNTSGALVTNQSVGMKISILLGSPLGTVAYSEAYSPNPQSNANGLVTIEIGGGIPITGIFSAIDWAAGQYFLKTETDPTGGTSFTISGTTQLLSVPYSLYSKTAGTADYNTLSNLPALNIANWNAAYGWGNHAGLYRPVGYVPSWSEITGKPTTLTGYGVTNPVNTTVLNVSCLNLASVSSTWTNLHNIGSFSKLNSASTVEVTYNGRIAVTGTIGGTGVRFELRIDGLASTLGYARAVVKSSEVGGAGVPVSITGIFTGLSAGTRTISMWVSDAYGTSTNIMLDPGCWSNDVVIIKEFR
jgi:hypothetical protein